MKITALLSLLFVIIAFAFAGCQSTTTVNDGYGIEMEEDSNADQAEVLK